MKKSSFFIRLIMVLTFSVPVSATVIKVPDEQPTIQAGLNSAQSGDTVLVSPGTYHENIDWPYVENIYLMSDEGCGGTVISGGHEGHVFTINGVQRLNIQGFTIRDGTAEMDTSGGGIYCNNSNMAISECRFTENSADGSWGGGGMYCHGGSPRIINNEFIGNLAGESAVGSAIAIVGSTAHISYNYFTENANPPSFPGAISIEYSASEISHNVITGNPTSGIFLWDGGGTIHHNLIYDNELSGITSLEAISAHLENNLIFHNGGFGILFNPWLAEARIVGNTITGNQGGMWLMNIESSLHVDHNIVTENDMGIEVFESNILPVFSYNDVWENTPNYEGIEDPTGQNGNISLDPLFCSCSLGNYFLSQTDAGQEIDSPCLDAGGELAPGPAFTTRTDLICDIDMRDLGYHYPAATATPTATPTVTPVNIPSSNPCSIIALITFIAIALKFRHL